MKSKIFVIITIFLVLTSGCFSQSRNLDISNVKLVPGEEVKSGFNKELTGHYWPSYLTFIITNKGSNTDSGHYSVYARIYDQSGNFVAKSIADYGSRLEPSESQTIRLAFGNLDWTKNINFNNIRLGRIEIVFIFFNDDGKSSNEYVYTINY